jgi:hypothetical protein
MYVDPETNPDSRPVAAAAVTVIGVVVLIVVAALVLGMGGAVVPYW